MSEYELLESTLIQILGVIKPSREDWVVRFDIITQFQAVLQPIYSLRGATVEPFGSFVSNLFTRWADLDISIEVPNGPYIASSAKRRKTSLLADVFRALREKGGYHKVKFIKNARVPILKFECTHQNISCDISINNLIGQVKSKFLFWISGIDERFRDMVLLVKEWAKAHGINNSQSGSLNSFSLSLLVVFHFQTCVPAILPPLKEIYPRNIGDDVTGIRADAEAHITETCAANIASFKSNRSRAINRSSLSELFIAFLAKFCNIDSMALEQGICVYYGQWEDISTNMRWLPKTYAIMIEDPFEQPGNASRAVSTRNLARISAAFKETHRRLASPIQKQTSIVATLVGPQIAQQIVRRPNGNQAEITGAYRVPNLNGATATAHFRIHPHAHRAVPTTSQVQHWSYNTRPARCLNNISSREPGQTVAIRNPPQGHAQNLQAQPPSHSGRPERRLKNVTPQKPVQTLPSKAQQVWRPKSDS